MTRSPSNDKLFVEGPDDGAVVNAIVERRFAIDIGPKRLVSAGAAGKRCFDSALDRFATAVANVHPGSGVGLLVDRDGIDGKPDRWGQVRGALERLKLKPPTDPPADGWISEGATQGSRLGVWLMPDNLRYGDLEMFLEEMLPADRALWNYAQTCTGGVPNSAEKFLPKDLRKANIHAWTAWLNPPGGGYGLAIKRGDLLHTTPAADRFLKWFERLYLIP